MAFVFAAFNHGLYKLSMGMDKFQPPQLRNHLTNFDEIGILELPSKDHPKCKIPFRSHDVMFSANTQFGTVRFLTLSFLTSSIAHSTKHRLLKLLRG